MESSIKSTIESQNSFDNQKLEKLKVYQNQITKFHQISKSFYLYEKIIKEESDKVGYKTLDDNIPKLIILNEKLIRLDEKLISLDEKFEFIIMVQRKSLLLLDEMHFLEGYFINRFFDKMDFNKYENNKKDEKKISNIFQKFTLKNYNNQFIICKKQMKTLFWDMQPKWDFNRQNDQLKLKKIYKNMIFLKRIIEQSFFYMCELFTSPCLISLQCTHMLGRKFYFENNPKTQELYDWHLYQNKIYQKGKKNCRRIEYKNSKNFNHLIPYDPHLKNIPCVIDPKRKAVISKLDPTSEITRLLSLQFPNM